MKAGLLIASVAVLAGVAIAQRATIKDSVRVWPKGQPPNGIEEKDDYGDHVVSITHREADGVVELHEHKDDVMIVQSGAAAMVYGGYGIGMRAGSSGEQHGEKIEGGSAVQLGPGDVITVAAGVSH